MAGMRRIEIARMAGTSPAAVTLAIKSGALWVGRDNRLDPEHPLNAQWIYAHQCGADTRGRLWRWPAPSEPGRPLDPAEIDAYDVTAEMGRLTRC